MKTVIYIIYYDETIPLGNAGAVFKLWELGMLENIWIIGK